MRVSPSTTFNAPGSCAAGATSKTERPRERALGERNEGWARPWAGVLKGVAGVFFLKEPSRLPPLQDQEGESFTSSVMSLSSLSLSG